MDALDKQLEALLMAQKAVTTKIVSNLRKPEKPWSGILPKYELPHLSATVAELQPSSPNQPVTYSAEQKAQAQPRREAETRQLQSRLGRLSKFAKSLIGLEYTVPIEPRNASELPGDFKAINTISLIVSTLYNLETCGIELRGVDGEAKTNVESFSRKSLALPSMTHEPRQLPFTEHTYYGYSEADHKARNPSQCTAALFATNDSSNSQGLPNPSSSDDNSTLPPHEVPDRAHIITIPTPPE